MRPLPLILILALLSQCSAPRPAPQAPLPVPTPPPPVRIEPPTPPTPPNWEDAPASAGDWVYRRDERGSLALFGLAGSDAELMVRCSLADRRVYISRKGAVASGIDAAITLRASSGLRRYPAGPTGATPSYLAIELAANDRQLDALAFSRGRFLVAATGTADLIAPAWAEVARIVEDCRR